MPIWIQPSQAQPSAGTSDGQTSTLRSSQKPNSDDRRRRCPRITGVFFGSWPSSTQKGITQQQIQAASESFT